MLFLIFFTLNSLLSAPAWSLMMAVAFNKMSNPENEFGKVRVWGTVGWMFGGILVSILRWDESYLVGLLAAGFLVGAAATALSLPKSKLMRRNRGQDTWHERLGFGAFAAFENRDTAIYYATAFLFSIPIAAFFPYTARMLSELGVERVSATFTLGQLMEIAAMFLLARVFRSFRIKWVFLFALVLGVARYLSFLFAAEFLPLIFFGILLHGILWTLFFESGRVFVNRRVDVRLRGQAQALLTVLTSGLGTMVGILFAGMLYRWCVEGDGPGWAGFWMIETLLCAIPLALFFFGYQGRVSEAATSPHSPTP